MKKFKFLLASLLLAVGAIAFTANNAKAQTDYWSNYTGVVNGAFTNNVSNSNFLANTGNWSVATPACDGFNIFLCGAQVTITAGTVTLQEIVNAIKAAADTRKSAGTTPLLTNGQTINVTGASGTATVTIQVKSV